MWKAWTLMAALALLSCRPHPATIARPGYPGFPAQPGQPGQPGRPGDVTPPGGTRGSPTRSGFLALRVHARQFAPGVPVHLVLINNTDRIAYFSSCAADLEREEDGRWSGGLYGAGSCPPVATPVPPNAFARHEVTLPSLLSPGRYRFRLELDAAELGAQTTVLSNTFRVR